MCVYFLINSIFIARLFYHLVINHEILDLRRSCFETVDINI